MAVTEVECTPSHEENKKSHMQLKSCQISPDVEQRVGELSGKMVDGVKKLSHKKWRRLLKKLKRKSRRQEYAQKKEEEEEEEEVRLEDMDNEEDCLIPYPYNGQQVFMIQRKIGAKSEAEQRKEEELERERKHEEWLQRERDHLEQIKRKQREEGRRYIIYSFV